MQTEAIERAGIDGTAAGTEESAGGGIAGFSVADGLMGTLVCALWEKSWRGLQGP